MPLARSSAGSDKRPTQRSGIIPNIEVKPTIEGIAAGRDELIKEALRRIESLGPVGSGTDAAVIQSVPIPAGEFTMGCSPGDTVP